MGFRRLLLASLLLASPAGARPGRAPAPPPPPPTPVVVPVGPAANLVAPVLLDPTWAGFDAGLHVVRVRDGQEVLAWRAAERMVPASTMKVLTAGAALDALGPSWVFTTDFLYDGELKGGVLTGNLYVEGHGDPTLTAERMWRALRTLEVEGLTKVDGDVVVDATYFPGPATLDGWDVPRDLAQGPQYYPVVGAAQLEFGTSTLVVRPGLAEGDPAVLVFDPPAGAYLSTEGEVRTGAANARMRFDMERRIEPDGRLVYVVEGVVPLDSAPRRYRRSVTDPTAYFVGVLDGLLDEVGPEVTGAVRPGAVPAEATRLRRLVSPPLASILMDMNKYSSNYMAETLARVLGAELLGEGTTAAGMRVVGSWLERQGVPDEEATLVNGSGLTRQGFLTPRALTRVLAALALDGRIGPEFVTSLSISGTDGTVERRLVEFPGRVRAKTGTLADVSGLVGYLRADDGELYAFAFLANGIDDDGGAVKRQEDALLRALLPYREDLAAPVDPAAAAPALTGPP